jgi:hypothetical protein
MVRWGRKCCLPDMAKQGDLRVFRTATLAGLTFAAIGDSHQPSTFSGYLDTRYNRYCRAQPER